MIEIDLQQVPPQPAPGDVPPIPGPTRPPPPVTDPTQVPPPVQDPDVVDPTPLPDAPPMVAGCDAERNCAMLGTA